jgi:thiamine pyrophosphate-dependent acetolactate synthase large subunit-like protein
MNGGEIIARLLKQQGVRFLFTLSGGHISPIFVEAEKQGIRVIDTRHEVTAAFAADAVARLTGIPGVATVTAGPGITNIITAIKNAQLAQSPLVLLGGAVATLLQGRGALQDIDQLSLMRPIVKWAARITKVKEIERVLSRAFYEATRGVPGPVFVECPVDILYPENIVREWYGIKSHEVPPKNIIQRMERWYINRHARKLFEDVNFKEHSGHVKDASVPYHATSDLKNALSKLNGSKKPVLVIGSGAIMNAQKANALSDAVNRLGLPVYLSGMARGLLRTDHPIQLRHHRKEAIRDADLIILAGVPNDFRLDYGNHIGHTPFISINRSRLDLYQNKKPTLAVQADPQEFLIALADHYQGKYTEWIGNLRSRDNQREEKINTMSEEVQAGINPLTLFRVLNTLLDKNTILIADGGDFVATAAYTLRPAAPLSWLDPGVFGTLGVGAGFALGAKLVYPEKDVWIIYGDGSAGYSLMEFDTFTRHQLPVVALIGNDGCWGQIARDQVTLLKSECAVNLRQSNYEKVAHAFGAEGVRVESIEDFSDSVTLALSKSRSGVPFIINAIISKSDFRKGSISM